MAYAGVYNETAFAALDYIIDTAAYNNIRLIFTFGDNWQYSDCKRNVSLLHAFEQCPASTKACKSRILLPSSCVCEFCFLELHLFLAHEH